MSGQLDELVKVADHGTQHEHATRGYAASVAKTAETRKPERATRQPMAVTPGRFGISSQMRPPKIKYKVPNPVLTQVADPCIWTARLHVAEANMGKIHMSEL